MIELAPNTEDAYIIPITKLYSILFDETKTFIELPGIDSVKDYGLQGEENHRRLEVVVKGKTLTISIHHYIRENGNCLAISKLEVNLIQLVLERFARPISGTLELFHDGTITGVKGSNRSENLRQVKQRQPSLNISERYDEIVLGRLPADYEFEHFAFTSFIADFILYTIERREIKDIFVENYTNTPLMTNESEFIIFINKLIQQIEVERPNRYYFNTDVFTDHHIWISDSNKVLNDTQAHFEIILRNPEKPMDKKGTRKVCIDIHFEKHKNDTQFILDALGELPDKVQRIKWHKGDSLSYYQNFDLQDPNLLKKVTDALDYLHDSIQDNLINIIYQRYHKTTVSKIFVNITWNSNDWMYPSEDKSSHDWVKQGNIGMESWNFAEGSEWNTQSEIYGYAKFTHNPKILKPAIFIFYSNDQIVGFYGDAALVNLKVDDLEKNLQGRRGLSFVLGNKIEKIKERGYLESKQRIGQIGFNYIMQDQTVLNILDESLKNNPQQANEINNLKHWFNTHITTNPSKSMSHPKNQILFGPPGTGKTYETINKALEIINDQAVKGLDWTDRKAVKDVFDEKINSGQIVFTTFHQSMAYEDFIEGIKPQEPSNEGDPISYLIEPGIFKSICQNAIAPPEVNRPKTDAFLEAAFFKMSLGGKLRPDIHDYCLENNVIALGYGNDEDFTELDGIKDWKTFRDTFKKNYPSLVDESKYNIQAIFIFQRMKIGDIVVITKGNHQIDSVGRITSEYFYQGQSSIEYHQFRSVEWLAKNINQRPEEFFRKKISQQSIYEFDVLDVKKEAFEKFFGQEVVADKNYVIIIDEINRGNVSAIFGEMITCIEESKRLGQPEAIKVVLPYSKDRFGVPDNVYIIGTMNTADRSVEALDTALRRRFSFTELLPDDKHPLIQNVEGVDLQPILNKINLRLEKLVSRDHTIGHAYFIGVSTLEQLYNAFYNKIIPLLQEYFFGDYGKLGLVLGPAFVKLEDENKEIFAKFKYEDEELLIERKVYRIQNFQNNSVGFLAAVRSI